jgi:hypothetical protein
MRIPTTDSVYRTAGRGTGKRGRYEREIRARYEPNETEDIDTTRVKTSFVMPSMTCDTEGRKPGFKWNVTVWTRISQPITVSIGGVCPGSKHVVLPAGEGCKRPAEPCNSSAEDGITREDAITSCQRNVNGRVPVSKEHSAFSIQRSARSHQSSGAGLTHHSDMGAFNARQNPITRHPTPCT